MRLPCHAVLLLVTAFASGCASQGAIAPEASLDERTGTTLSHLNAALQLVATAPGAPSGDPFAFIAPFETNRMGRRQAYLWVAVPGEDGVASRPVVLPDARELRLAEAPSEALSLGIDAMPYAAPAPWSKVFIYLLDEPALRQLEAARSMIVRVQYPRAGALDFAGPWDGGGAIAAFRRSLGLSD